MISRIKQTERPVLCVVVGHYTVTLAVDRMYVTEAGDLLMFRGKRLVASYAAGVWSSAMFSKGEGQ